MSSMPSEHREEPTTEDELRGALARLRRNATQAAFVGYGSRIAHDRPELDPDSTTFLSTRSLVASGSTGIVEYVPGDGTLTAQGGASIEVLRAAVAEGGHRIPALGPLKGASLGGLLASGHSSIDRMGFGPLRHHVLGMRVLDATGNPPAKTGGRLVKNVTGFDLHRVHTGARGTLGVILEASLRLMPVPEAEVHLASDGYASAAEATACALALRDERRIQPRVLFVHRGAVHLCLAGRERQVEVEKGIATDQIGVTHSVHGSATGSSALAAAEHDRGLRFATAPSRVLELVNSLESLGLRDLYVEPDAAFVDVPTAALDGDPVVLIDSLNGPLGPAHVHVSPLDGGLSGAPWGEALHSRHPVPTGQRTWADRLREAFDPDGILSPRPMSYL